MSVYVGRESSLFFSKSSFSDTPALNFAKTILRISLWDILLWYDGDWLHSSISPTSSLFSFLESPDWSDLKEP